jgi:hypothetical protein
MKKWIISVLLLSWIAIALSIYFSVFHGPLSTQSGDWGSFGGYISGVITVPFSVISAYFLYQTYKDTQRSYIHALMESKIIVSHAAIREAASYLESALDCKITIDGNELSFRDVNYNPRVARGILTYVKSHNDLNAHYRVTVGKAFLCLYDFLGSSENKYGQTDVIKFYKIQYQWVIRLHNTYELGIIEYAELGVFSKDIEEYFYNT